MTIKSLVRISKKDPNRNEHWRSNSIKNIKFVDHGNKNNCSNGVIMQPSNIIYANDNHDFF